MFDQSSGSSSGNFMSLSVVVGLEPTGNSQKILSDCIEIFVHGVLGACVLECHPVGLLF